MVFDYCHTCKAAVQVAAELGISLEEMLEMSRWGKEEGRRRESELSPEERAAREQAARERYDRKLAGVLPEHIEPLGRWSELTCTYFAADDKFDRVTVRFDDRGVRCFDPVSRIQLLHRGWDWVQSVAVESPDHLKTRVTVPRLIGTGVLAFGFKKTFQRTYVVVQLTTHEEHYFEINGHELHAVRAHLSPVIAWFSRNASALHDPSLYDRASHDVRRAGEAS